VVNPSSNQVFRHQALFYAGEDEFLAGTVPFIRDAVWGGEPVLVAVSQARAAAIAGELNGEADAVHFVDMAELGRNPACIIPAWSDFVEAHGAQGRPLRGIGEPIWADRSPAELVECQRHESLLNLAFADTPSFWLLCPYDTDALEAAVIEEAQRSHPYLTMDGSQLESASYSGTGSAAEPFRAPLPEPAGDVHVVPFDAESVPALRKLIAREASDAGVSEARKSDLVLAVSEVATNSVRYGGGHGVLRLWQDRKVLVCEISDQGSIDEPLAGRMRPDSGEIGGYGLWLVNQLCDLVQIRSFASGSVARMHVRVE
jgi:anti-sigma regulatory factor (Ser/Thr protein kinase)